MSLYLNLLIASVAIPLVLSFDKKLQFYKKWKSVFPSLLIIASIYILCDIFLTKLGVWGFNNDYLLGTYVFNLPVEEWIFFFVIPYASIFLHYSFVLYFPKIKISESVSKMVSIVLIIIMFTALLFHAGKIYTSYIVIKMIAVLTIVLLFNSKILQSYFITFVIILIPFIVVNGILTGSFIQSEVVWYNNNEILGIRIFTIPIEDFVYAFSLILFNLLLIEKFQQIFSAQKP